MFALPIFLDEIFDDCVVKNHTEANEGYHALTVHNKSDEYELEEQSHALKVHQFLSLALVLSKTSLLTLFLIKTRKKNWIPTVLTRNHEQ